METSRSWSPHVQKYISVRLPLRDRRAVAIVLSNNLGSFTTPWYYIGCSVWSWAGCNFIRREFWTRSSGIGWSQTCVGDVKPRSLANDGDSVLGIPGAAKC